MKEKLKVLSEERAEQWPNTIKALRTKRILARKEQLEKLEEERCRLDKIDAANRAEKRRQQIEKANKSLQLPHLTAIRSKMLIGSVLQERDAQLLYKERVLENWKRQEQKWLELQKQQRENWKEEEKLEMREKKESLKALCEARLEQVKGNRLQLLREKEHKELEKEQLRQQAEQDQKDNELKEQLRKRRADGANLELIESNRAQQARKEQEKEKLKNMDIKIAEYVAKREHMLQERKEADNAKAAHKAALHDAMIARQEQALLAARVDSEVRLQAQEKGRKVAEDTREKIRAKKNHKDWEACDHSRKRQIHLRKQQLEEEREEEKDEALKFWQRSWQVKADDEAEEKLIVSRNRKLAEHHMKTVVRKAEEELLELEESNQEYLQAFQRLKEEDVQLEALTI
ncbi:hypothetical protein O6H91_16G064200 [Diphasiastrum complanatum]|uniref:Uncharacterized protein n=1 Tax=Diphasiastrum complanatum TaxID=34168 RepID=A0ACC2BCX4_DIPCM|nr:hypothetical protein O6H91_16G064200 [Diphasiastrum complanatum]